MQAVEALTRLLAMADESIKSSCIDPESLDQDDPSLQRFQEDQIAIAVIQAMLNTALPVARFRCFVRIESGKAKGREYTLCAVRIEDIVAALHPLGSRKTDVYILLFEQRATGADALDGYQGSTGKGFKASPSFLAYLEGLRKYAELAN